MTACTVGLVCRAVPEALLEDFPEPAERRRSLGRAGKLAESALHVAEPLRELRELLDDRVGDLVVLAIDAGAEAILEEPADACSRLEADVVLAVQVSYTAAKLIDNVNERFVGGANFTNPYDLNTARSISPNDISQRIVGNFVWELPFGRGHRWLSRGIGGWLLGNWQGSGIVTLQTGTPLAIGPSCSTQLSGIGCYADRVGNGALPENQRTLDKYFNTAAYVNPQPFSLGNGTRTEPNLRNPGQIGFDSVLSRWQPIRERMRMQLRFEMYNMLNHPNLGSPNTTITSTNFGQITSKNGNRTMQAALRLEF